MMELNGLIINRPLLGVDVRRIDREGQAVVIWTEDRGTARALQALLHEFTKEVTL